MYFHQGTSKTKTAQHKLEFQVYLFKMRPQEHANWRALPSCINATQPVFQHNNPHLPVKRALRTYLTPKGHTQSRWTD